MTTKSNKESKAYVAKLYVLGALALTAINDKNITPSGRKAQGVLALLALSPRGQRTRAWLKSKLWCESNESHASASLRQTLFELKRDLGPYWHQLFISNRQYIALNTDALWIDALALKSEQTTCQALNIDPDTEVLEGIDIAEQDFEEWLCTERQVWSEYLASHCVLDNTPSRASTTAAPPQARLLGLNEIQTQGFSLGILPSIVQGCDEQTQIIPDIVIEQITHSLHELLPLDVVDLRENKGLSEISHCLGETDLYLRVRALQVHHCLTFTAAIYKSAHLSQLWSNSTQLEVKEIFGRDKILLDGFISQNIDRIIKTLLDESSEGYSPDAIAMNNGFAALNLMYDLDEGTIDKVKHLLNSQAEQCHNALYPALSAYATSFTVGENLGDFNKNTLSVANSQIRLAQQQTPFNSISLACLGHALGYVLKEHNMAGEMFERAVRLSPVQPLVWDHYALHKLYCGDYNTAHQYAKKAVYLGAYSLISYSYDTTLLMACTLLGRFEEAVIAGERALFKQPKFTAAMRYLTVAYAHLGRQNQAHALYQKLLTHDPDFESLDTQRQRFRIDQRNGEKQLLEGIAIASRGLQ